MGKRIVRAKDFNAEIRSINFILPMNILLLGSGGREHALAWKLSQSSSCDHLFIAPGNAGTAQCGQNVELDPGQFPALASFCIEQQIQMVVVGPEEPLVNGLADFFRAHEQLRNIYFIGPSKAGAQLEGSKAFAKAFMKRHQIPTAAYREFTQDQFETGLHYLRAHALPIVLKADGLAAGKGVLICSDHQQAISEFELMLKHQKFGEASRTVVVEQFLEGIELSVFALTDGQHYVLLPEAKDYKRIGEGDTGLNTGGMGAVSPVPFATPSFMEKVERTIIQPTIKGLAAEQIDYKGFLFFGLINVGGDPYVIEYNCRMGDPETEVVIPRLENDLVSLLVACAQQTLQSASIRVDPRCAATVVAVSGGYPGTYEKGKLITGPLQNTGNDPLVFQAGTQLKDGKIVTNGGRVLCVTAYGSSLGEAVQRSRKVLDQLSYEGLYYRRDIGYEFS